MSDKPRQTVTQTVSSSGSALANYLDTLLAEIDNVDSLPPEQPVKEPIDGADTLLQEPVSHAATLSDSQGDASEAVEPARMPAPAWAKLPFPVLRIAVDGVNLVVPLMHLKGIMPLSGALSRLPGQPAWSLGVVMNRDDKVVAVDTRRLLMPEREVTNPAYSHLLLVGDGDRGLAVEALGDTVMLDTEAIRWRGRGGAMQPWYGGILVEELSVLLDIDGVMEMLAA